MHFHHDAMLLRLLCPTFSTFLFLLCFLARCNLLLLSVCRSPTSTTCHCRNHRHVAHQHRGHPPTTPTCLTQTRSNRRRRSQSHLPKRLPERERSPCRPSQAWPSYAIFSHRRLCRLLLHCCPRHPFRPAPRSSPLLLQQRLLLRLASRVQTILRPRPHHRNIPLRSHRHPHLRRCQCRWPTSPIP